MVFERQKLIKWSNITLTQTIVKTVIIVHVLGKAHILLSGDLKTLFL